MVDINRAGRIQEKEIRSQLDRMEMIEALRHGNIYEVFAKSKTFKIGEFNDFFANQWKSWRGGVIQDTDIKTVEGSFHEPDINQFPIHHRGAAMSAEEGEIFRSQMANLGQRAGGRFKATGPLGEDSPEGARRSAADEGPMSEGELHDAARGTLDDWQNFMDSTWSQILDAQMMSNYRSRMSEVEQEVRRIIELVKQGVMGPEFALIALAKVNSTKNGVLMSWLGQKAAHVNESLNRIANDLHSMSPTDPRYASELQIGQSRSRDGAFQLNLLTTDMQKVMQDVASVLEQVHSMMSEINRTRREIITKVSAN